MTNNLVMNGFSTGFGVVVSQTTDDWKPMAISLAVAFLSELIKYLKAKNRANTVNKSIDVDPTKPTLMSSIFKNLLRKNR